jgi:hypothetical protein
MGKDENGGNGWNGIEEGRATSIKSLRLSLEANPFRLHDTFATPQHSNRRN